MSIKISVIIPTFRRPLLLIKCLGQLAQQHFSKCEYEVIVVTDGPDEETSNVITDVSNQHKNFNVSCLSLAEKKGPAAARNKGVENARGQLIVFTDDDCLPQRSWLVAYWHSYVLMGLTEAAFTGQTIVPYSQRPTDYEKNIAHLQTAEFITANCAISKTAFQKLGGFDEAFLTAWREDSDLHFKLLEALIPVKRVHGAFVTHPVRKAKWGVSLKEQKKSLFNALLYKKHSRLYKEKINVNPLWNYYAMILFFSLFLTSIINAWLVAGAVFFVIWFALVIEFTLRRLKSTSKKASHIFEMIITSALIPFLSVFWTLYGSFKYKILLL